MQRQILFLLFKAFQNGDISSRNMNQKKYIIIIVVFFYSNGRLVKHKESLDVSSREMMYSLLAATVTKATAPWRTL